MTARLSKIFTCKEKGAETKSVSLSELDVNYGLVEDYKSRTSDKNRQISILLSDVREKIDKDYKTIGLCTRRFQENLLIDGLDLRDLTPKSRFKIGSSKIEITDETKKCFEECELVKDRDYCSLKTGVLFAKVIEGGIIKVGDEIMKLTHFNENGRAHMVDVNEKEETKRAAVARGTISMKEETLELIKEGKMKKGDVLSVAQIGGIMGVKKTSDLIPMCHNIFISGSDIRFNILESSIEIEAEVKTYGKTGVEMEALTAVSMAALTIYDMCKAVDKDMVISDIRLIKKTGGKSGTYIREE